MVLRVSHTPAPLWSDDQLQQDLEKATLVFREGRMGEPLEKYLERYEECRDAFDELLELTVDLGQLQSRALEILSNEKYLDAFRYLAGPPMSEDDLMTVAEVNSLSSGALGSRPDAVHRLIETVLMNLDRRRFPWVAEQREASENERGCAIVASATLMATRKLETERRNEGKTIQEQQVRDMLLELGFEQVQCRPVYTHNNAPVPGQFCMESQLGTRKADLIVGLWDQRILPIECKVSNSATNSIKRLNNDAAAKAEVWRKEFGEVLVVPTAVLSGVYKLKNLQGAQRRGLTLFWAHSLSELAAWIQSTKAAS